MTTMNIPIDITDKSIAIIGIIVSVLALIVSFFSAFFTYKINRKIENFDKNQYKLAIDSLKDTLSMYKGWCEDYTKKIQDNQYSIRNILFPIEIFQSIISSNTQRDDFFALKHAFLALIMQINTINSLHQDITSLRMDASAQFGIGHKDKLKSQLIDDLQNFKEAISEFQKEFLN
jgi:hypothetical protein